MKISVIASGSPLAALTGSEEFVAVQGGATAGGPVSLIADYVKKNGPSGTAAASATLTAFEPCLFDATGIGAADATDTSKPCNAIVKSGYASAATATFYVRGQMIAGLSGLTKGAAYYLAVGGGMTATPPSTSGQGLQKLGFALSTTEFFFDPEPIQAVF